MNALKNSIFQLTVSSTLRFRLPARKFHRLLTGNWKGVARTGYFYLEIYDIFHVEGIQLLEIQHIKLPSFKSSM